MCTVTVLAFAAGVGRAQQTGDVVRGELGARVDSMLTRAAAYGLSGSIIVAQRGEIVLQKGYGLADRERKVAVSVETPFFIGSLAKQFTATAVLRLAADGRLSLDDSLGTFFPAVPADKRAITVRQLLSHTSGLPYLPTAGLFGGGSRDSVMREMLAERLAFEPGARYEYSTPGYNLLAGIIERASGTTYELYLRRLFARTGLEHTGFVGERPRWSAWRVRSYTDATAETALADIPALPRFVGAGSIVSTVSDLYRWYGAVTLGDVLPPPLRDALFTPVVRVRPNVEEAFTWLLVTLPTGTMRQAAGDIGGFNAELRHYVDEQLVVVFVSNGRVRGRGYRDAVMNAVARMSRGERIPLPPRVTGLSAAEVDSLVGTYTLDDGGTLEVWAADDSLLIGAKDGGGIASLAGHDTSAARRATTLDDRAREFLGALALDSVAETFMHASIPADSRRAYVRSVKRLLGDSAASRGIVIGTAIDGPLDARSYVRFDHPDGAEVVALLWTGGKLVGVEPSGRAAYTLRLRGEGPGSVAAFDLFTGRLVRVGLTGERELAIVTSGVRRRAVR